MSKLASIFACGLIASIFSIQCSSLSRIAGFSSIGVRCDAGAGFLRARLSPQPLGRLRSKWRAVRLHRAPGCSAGRRGRAAHRVSIRLLLLCPVRPVRPHAVTINPVQDVSTDGVLE